MIIGYTQGTFDMFHIGHLNLIKRAKEHCDYLIVGVNSDELVLSYKNKSTIVPLNERVEIISALKYVDDVIVCSTLDKMSTYLQHKYDIIFIGDDWKNSERWKNTEESLSKVGVKVEYLPYTKDTSSTLLREKLNGY